MNYQRIYAELIADRRANPPSADEYAERHHIVPRCMGGGDEAANLIRLRPEDHYFAHLLLAKVHGGRNWRSVHAMCLLVNKASAERRSKLAARVQFGHVRRSIAAHYRSLCGPKSKKSDKTEYELRSFSGSVVRGTRFGLSDQTGITRQQISAILRGAKRSAHGWFSPLTNPEGITRGERLSAALRSSEIFTLYHHDGRIWTGSLSWQNNSSHIAGWHKTPEDAAAFYSRIVQQKTRTAAARGSIAGSRNPNAHPTVYRWRVVKTGEIVEATRAQMDTGSGNSFCELFSGRRKSAIGIELAVVTDEILELREAYRKSRRKGHRVGRDLHSNPGGEVCRPAAQDGGVYEG